MTVDQLLQQEIKDSEVWISREKDESTYKRDLQKRIELINWVLENMKNPNLQICEVMESRMNDVILKINQTHDIFEADKLHSELRILDYLFYEVCEDQQKNWLLIYNPRSRYHCRNFLYNFYELRFFPRNLSYFTFSAE